MNRIGSKLVLETVTHLRNLAATQWTTVSRSVGTPIECRVAAVYSIEL